MDEQKNPSSSHESGELVLEDENQVLKPPPRRKKSLRKTRMEAEKSRTITASHSGKAEKEQLKTSLDDNMINEEPSCVSVDNNNTNTAKLGENLENVDSKSLQLPAAQTTANEAENKSEISESSAENKSNSEGISESKAGEAPEDLSGCKMTTKEDQVSKMENRNMNNTDYEVDKMGNKNGRGLKTNAKTPDENNTSKAKVIQNGDNGLNDTSSAHQDANNAVVVSENFESFCLVDNVAKTNGKTGVQSAEQVVQDSKKISSSEERDSSLQSCCDAEKSTSGISMSDNVINCDTSDLKPRNNTQLVNNSSCDLHEGLCLHDDKRILQQVGINSTNADHDEKETMYQLQRNDDNITSNNLEQKLRHDELNLVSNEKQSQNTLHFQNPLCEVFNPDIKINDNAENELTQKQCTSVSNIDDDILSQDNLLPINSGKEIKGIRTIAKKIEEGFPYENLEDSTNQDNTCEGDLGDDEDNSTDTDSDTYYSDFTSSEGEYDMEDAEKLCYSDDEKEVHL